MQNIEFGVVTQKVLINVEEGTAFTPFSPVDENGAIANNGDAYGIVIDALGIGEVKQLVVMTAGCIDKIFAEQHYGESYSAEAISALENIVIYDNHKIGGGGGASGYDELSDGNITEVDGKKVLTPLGGGVVIKPLDVEITMTATEDGEITWGEENIAEGKLIVGETYRVTVNGVAGDYVCYVDDYGNKIIGTFEYDMAVGDWQIVSYHGAGVYVNVYGDVGEQFTFKVYGKTEAVHTIDRQYLPYVPSIYYLLVANDDGHYSADDARGMSMTVKDANNFISNPQYYGVPLVSCTNGAVHRFYIDSATFVTKFDNLAGDVVDVHYLKVSSCLNLDGNDDDVALFDFINY